MSSWLRLSIIMVLALATGALGLIAYNANKPIPVAQVAQAPAVAQNAPAPPAERYYFAKRPLPTGTLVHDEDFEVRAAQRSDVPVGAILESRDAKIELRRSVVRQFLGADDPITWDDVFQTTTVVVYARGKPLEYTVKKEGIAAAGLASGSHGYTDIARPSAVALAGSRGEKAKE